MKFKLTFLAMALMFLVACKKDDGTDDKKKPDPEPKTAAEAIIGTTWNVSERKITVNLPPILIVSELTASTLKREFKNNLTGTEIGSATTTTVISILGTPGETDVETENVNETFTYEVTTDNKLKVTNSDNETITFDIISFSSKKIVLKGNLTFQDPDSGQNVNAVWDEVLTK
jgi:hypothetical protein